MTWRQAELGLQPRMDGSEDHPAPCMLGRGNCPRLASRDAAWATAHALAPLIEKHRRIFVGDEVIGIPSQCQLKLHNLARGYLERDGMPTMLVSKLWFAPYLTVRWRCARRSAPSWSSSNA